MTTEPTTPSGTIAPVNAVGEPAAGEGDQFQDRRNPTTQRQSSGHERRQFTNSMSEYTEEAAELGQAIDQYKLIHRRRFINYEELLSVIKSIGYTK